MEIFNENMWMMYLFLFIFGTIIGSFLNVIIYRVPKNISIVTPPSKCTNCNKKIKYYDLVPILSYIVLKGKCRYCSNKISIKYPLIELITGILTMTYFIINDLTIENLFIIILIYILIVVCIIDYEYMIIPNGLILTGICVFVIYFFFQLIYNNIILYNNLLAGLIGFLIMLIIYLIGFLAYKKEALGAGDLKLFLVIGLFMGIKLTIVSFVFSIFIGGIWGSFVILSKKKNRRDEMAFGPFISIGTIIAIYFGEVIYNWYMNFLI